MTEILTNLLALITGGVAWEGLKFLFPEIKRIIKSRRDASAALYKNLDPLLKASSELFGKLESLAKEDFATFANPLHSNSKNPEHNQVYVYYLFAQFWAQLENLRLQSQYTSLTKLKKGKQLIRFIETIESRKFRLLDRSVQRIIGENLISGKDQKFIVMTLNDFVTNLNNPASGLSKWNFELESFFTSMKIKRNRQHVLRFGIIVACLINHFDPKSQTVRRRDIYKNKLSEKSKKMIRFELFNHYLPFIKSKISYY